MASTTLREPPYHAAFEDDIMVEPSPVDFDQAK
jgi:hypothetical protein